MIASRTRTTPSAPTRTVLSNRVTLSAASARTGVVPSTQITKTVHSAQTRSNRRMIADITPGP
ncbi:hypothetical protein GCM10023085_56450 [Actinomadura viridis]